MNKRQSYTIIFAWVLLFNVLGSVHLCLAQDFGDKLLSREVKQSPFGTNQSAADFNINLYNKIGFRSGALIKSTAIATSDSIKYITDNCYSSEDNKQRCKEEFRGDPVQSLMFEQALEVEDVIASSPLAYESIGVSKKYRFELLKKVYLDYKNRGQNEDPNSPYSLIRDRLSKLSKEYTLEQLDGEQGHSARLDPIGDLSRAITNEKTELDRIIDLTNHEYFPSPIIEPTQRAAQRVKEIDGQVKSVVKKYSVNTIVYFKTGVTATEYALTAANILGAPPEIKENLEKLNKVASTGFKIANIALTLGKATGGDIRAWFNAYNSVASLFGGPGPSVPSFESQVLDTLNEILKNQKKIVERLDYIISRIDNVRNQINELHKDVVVIDQNVRLLITGQQEIIQSDFNSCFLTANRIVNNVEVKKTNFNHLSSPYNEEIYFKIIEEANNQREQNSFVPFCTRGANALFKKIAP